jgi:hypothetical protein
MPVYIVSNRSLRALWFLKWRKFYEISYPNCFLDGSLQTAINQIQKERLPGVYLIAAGLPAALAVQALHKEMPESWFLDLGSIWDGFVGIGEQRGFRGLDLYANPDRWESWYAANLEGVLDNVEPWKFPR